ncbi:MAG TPA: glycosyltransferase [Candidatus Acidoferrales bacterium]|nr:glycosyltransferase [Candidatus Acidoferrales bacterium]
MLIVWLSSRLPYPLDSGGQIRTYHILRQLKRRHDVILVTFADRGALTAAGSRLGEIAGEIVAVPPPAKKSGWALYRDALRHLANPLPYVIAKYAVGDLRASLESTLARRPADLLVCDYLTPAPCVPENVGIPSLIFEHNVEAVIWDRLAEQEKNPLKRLYLRSEARKLMAFEEKTLRRFSACIAVSEQDRDFFRRRFRLREVHAVPTAVDTEFFSFSARNGRPAAPELVFVGSMDWVPNQDAVRYFVKEIFPAVRRRVPDSVLTVVGRNPPASIARLEREVPAVQVTGTVADVRPYLQRARAVVVPLRVGGGTRIKIFEAMASGAPVVSTSVGAEGLPLENGREILLADTPEAFASACVRVLTDHSLAQGLARRARALVEAKFSWEEAGRAFEQICLDTVRKVKHAD